MIARHIKFMACVGACACDRTPFLGRPALCLIKSFNATVPNEWNRSYIINLYKGKGDAMDCGKFPCGVCFKGVGSNSIYCALGKHWIHKRCSGKVETLR